MKSEMSDFKANLQEEIDNTQNPLVRGTREIVDLAFMESSCARAIASMQQYDPEFDF